MDSKFFSEICEDILLVKLSLCTKKSLLFSSETQSFLSTIGLPKHLIFEDEGEKQIEFSFVRLRENLEFASEQDIGDFLIPSEWSKCLIIGEEH